MPASIFSDAELARLAGFPEEIPLEDLIRAFTLTGADLDLVANRRGAANRLGLALQLCALRYLGFVPPDLSVAPQPAVRFVADQLEVSPKALQGYACREQTRREHRAEIRQHLGFSVPRPRDLLALETWLVDRALEHDSPRLLFRLSGERLRSQNLVFPSPDRVVRLVTSARSRALDRTYALLEPLLNGRADVVFGSRFSVRYERCRHVPRRAKGLSSSLLGNRAVTCFSNLLSGLQLTDMETCYKLIPTEILRQLKLRSGRFGIEPELTARLAKLKLRIYEVPISYLPRQYSQGKKINWKDGLAALWHIIRFNLLN